MSRLAWIAGLSAVAGIVVGGVAYAATRKNDSPGPSPNPAPGPGPSPQPPAPPVPPQPTNKYVWEPVPNPATIKPGQTYLISIDDTSNGAVDPAALVAFQTAQQAIANAGGSVQIVSCPSEVEPGANRRCAIVTVPQGVPQASLPTVPVAFNVRVYIKTLLVE